MNYTESMTYIESLTKYGSIYGLDRIRELLRRVGNPQEKLSIVHIAGTNGKGSFGTFLGEILKEAGYKTGRYISPAVLGYRERIQVDGQWIGESDIAEILTFLRQICLDMKNDGLEHPTAFEVETAMAFIYFERKTVDFVLLEAGLGGKNDSTNVIGKPKLSVMTSISLDHTAILGDTLEEITLEKSGIIKGGHDVLMYDQSPAVTNIVKEVCTKTKSRFYQTDWSQIHVTKQSLDGQQFDYEDLKSLVITMAGTYQIYNAAAAVCAANILNRQGAAIKNEHIYIGLKNARWPGRFEVFKGQPVIIADGAHNPEGAQRLGESIDKCLKEIKIVYVAGIFADKDYEHILEALAPYSDTIFTHKPMTKRGLPAVKLAAEAKTYYKNVYACESLDDAMNQAMKVAGKDGAVVSFGSLSTIANLKNWLRNHQIVL